MAEAVASWFQNGSEMFDSLLRAKDEELQLAREQIIELQNERQGFLIDESYGKEQVRLLTAQLKLRGQELAKLRTEVANAQSHTEIRVGEGNQSQIEEIEAKYLRARRTIKKQRIIFKKMAASQASNIPYEWHKARRIREQDAELATIREEMSQLQAKLQEIEGIATSRATEIIHLKQKLAENQKIPHGT